ncbi:hypothetical protein BN128_3422 [Cronobacter sakazakii 696]|nr:hypothetical protein BN128_3422 [Cronobacter sakazakii 696]
MPANATINTVFPALSVLLTSAPADSRYFMTENELSEAELKIKGW